MNGHASCISLNGHANCISLGDTFYILWCVFFTMNFYLFLPFLFLSFYVFLSFIFLLYLCEAKSWILKWNHSTVSGVLWELGNIGAIGMLCHMLPRIVMPSATVLLCGCVFLCQVTSSCVSQYPALCSSSGWLSYLLFWVFIKALEPCFYGLAALLRSLHSILGPYQMHICLPLKLAPTST